MDSLASPWCLSLGKELGTTSACAALVCDGYLLPAVSAPKAPTSGGLHRWVVVGMDARICINTGRCLTGYLIWQIRKRKMKPLFPFVSLWAWVILPTSDHSWGLPTNLDLVLLDLIFAMVPVKTWTLFSSWSSYNKAIINLCDDCTHWHNLLAEAIVYYLGFTSHTKSKTWEYASHGEHFCNRS